MSDPKHDDGSHTDPENEATEIEVPASETADHREADLTAEEVRQGHTGDHVRIILLASLGGVAIVFLIVYFLFMR